MRPKQQSAMLKSGKLLLLPRLPAPSSPDLSQTRERSWDVARASSLKWRHLSLFVLSSTSEVDEEITGGLSLR